LTNIVGRKGGSVPLPPSQRARAARQA
jgi:hypothetical protein